MNVMWKSYDDAINELDGAFPVDMTITSNETYLNITQVKRLID